MLGTSSRRCARERAWPPHVGAQAGPRRAHALRRAAARRTYLDDEADDSSSGSSARCESDADDAAAIEGEGVPAGEVDSEDGEGDAGEVLAGLAVAAVHNTNAGPFRLPAAQGAAARVPEGRRCGCCGVPGHNSRTCEFAGAGPSSGAAAARPPGSVQAGARLAPASPPVGGRGRSGIAGIGTAAPRAVPGGARVRADADVEDGGLFHFSVTIVNGQGRDVSADHLDGIADFADTLAPPDALWALSTERGAKEGHLHFQGLLATSFSSPAQLTRRLKAFFATLGPLAAQYSVRAPRPAKRMRAHALTLTVFHAQARSKALTGKSMHTPLGMVGYVTKDAGKEHYRCRMSASLTPEVLAEAKREYLRFGNVTNKGMAALNQRNIFEKAETFRQTNMLDSSLPFRSIVVLMLRSGIYFLSYSFITSGGSASGMNVERADALFRLTSTPELPLLDDIALVLYGRPIIGMWTEDDAIASVPLTELQVDAHAARVAAGMRTVEGIAASVLAANADMPAAAAVPSRADHVLAINLKRVRDDDAALKEATRRSSRRKYSAGESPCLEFHIGPTGAGKSKAVGAKYASAYRFDVSNGGSSEWLDGYEGEDTIVMDEFRGELSFKMIKMLCGWDPCTFQVKGSMVNVLAKKFVFTSTQPPEGWYEDPDKEWARRIDDFGTIYRYSAPAPRDRARRTVQYVDVPPLVFDSD